MTAKIKLNAASGGGSFSLQAPSSSANNRVMTLPDSADGTVLTTTNPKAGNIIQVVQVNYATAVESTNTSSYTDTGLAGTITPASSSNKILVMLSQNFRLASATNGGQNGGSIQILRGSTNITTNQQAYLFYNSNGQSASLFNYSNYSVQVLDSPSTTSATTYKTQQIVYGTGNSIFANYAGKSYLTLMEIAE
jgi:hypothetical protein